MKKGDISLQDLCKIKLAYKTLLDIPDFIKFGIEIEFSDAKLEDVKDIFNRRMNNGLPHTKYQRWVVKEDGTVTTTRKDSSGKVYQYQNTDASWEDDKSVEYEYEDIIYGGEINTPIMYDAKEDWLNLKKACSFLRQIEDIRISDKCALHFHTNRNIFDRPIELLRYLELRILYQDIIYRFGYGTKNSARSSISKHAKPFNADTIIKIKNIIRSKKQLSWHEVLLLIDLDRRLGFSIYNINEINHREYNLKNTYEDRNANSSLSEIIIQNDFEFSIRLKLLCRNENFDWDKIDYMFLNIEEADFSFAINEDFDKALKLAQMIYDNDIDRLRFLKQYMKAFTDDDKQEFKAIEKQYKL